MARATVSARDTKLDREVAVMGREAYSRQGIVYAKNCRMSVNTADSFSGPIEQIFLRTNVVCIVKSFAGFTIDFFGRMPSMQSLGSMVSAPSSRPAT